MTALEQLASRPPPPVLSSQALLDSLPSRFLEDTWTPCNDGKCACHLIWSKGCDTPLLRVYTDEDISYSDDAIRDALVLAASAPALARALREVLAEKAALVASLATWGSP